MIGLAAVLGGVGRVAGVGDAEDTDEGAVVGPDEVDDDQEEPVDGDIVVALAPVSLWVSQMGNATYTYSTSATMMGT